MEKTWREELAWAAGFFDGEGHTRANFQHGRIWQLRVDITQHDRRPLDRFARAVGVGKVYGPYDRKNPNHGDRYQYYAIARGAQAVVAMLWSWLSEPKKAQAATALLKVKSTRHHIRTGLKPTCRRGHPFDEKNTRLYVQGKNYSSRFCRQCGAERQRIRRQRKLAHALLVAV